MQKRTLPPPRKLVSGNLYRSAFLASVQPKLIVGINGAILSANKAASVLLGYSRKEILSKKRSEIFEVSEEDFQAIGFLQKQDTSDEKKYVIRKKDGTAFDCYLRCVPFLDQKVAKAVVAFSSVIPQAIPKAKRKTAQQPNLKPVIEEEAAVDSVTALRELDLKLAESYKLKKSIGKMSYDLMWDWNLTTDKFDIGESVTELFGYNIKGRTLSQRNVVKCLVAREKARIVNKMAAVLLTSKKLWGDSFTIQRQDGSLAFTVSRATIVRDEDGKALHVVGATQDISRVHELEQQLKDQVDIQEELSDIFDVASSLSFDGRWDWNLITNEFFFGAGFEALFGYDVNERKENTVLDWTKYLHPDDKTQVEADLQKAIVSDSNYWEYAYRFIRADKSFARVFNRVSIIRNAKGKAIRMIGVMQDVSKQELLEEQLAQEIKLKDRKVAEAAEEAKESERADIGKELHDNVNQLLGASRMYLEVAKKGGADTDEMIVRSSEITMLAIEEIRKLTKGLTTDFIRHLGLKDVIENLCEDTMKLSKVRIEALIHPLDDSIEDKLQMNIFRIVQEQLTNILKHAAATYITVSLAKTADEVNLTITDDGRGFDTQLNRKGIGVDNIVSRARAFKGTAIFDSSPGNGCTLAVSFPIASN